jgi:peptidoglycan hydrolase-like protein with peptidoglycan-binding domain
MTVGFPAIKAVCDTWAGRTERPANSNHIFIWDDLKKAGYPDFNGSAYCAAGIVDEDLKAKTPIIEVQSPFYCPSRVQYYRAHGLWVAGHQDIEPGDEVFYGWTAQAIQAGLAEHVERAIGRPGKVTVKTFGCNTSSGTTGSQSNGDGCFYRSRNLDATILGVGKYSKLLPHEKPPLHKIRRNPFAQALRDAGLPLHVGNHGDAVSAIQWAVGVPVDGAFGSLTDHGVRTFQRFHKDRYGRPLRQDGEVGKLTRWALLQVTHYEH